MRLRPPAGQPRVGYLTLIVVAIPFWRCLSTGHHTLYVPFFRETVSFALPPPGMTLEVVLTPGPLIDKACGANPTLRILNVWVPGWKFFFESAMKNSDSITLTGVSPAQA
ncbi:hypothetical protein [Streptosporangium fragile]|uniref:hypothetical protein n=1 Tax=Streptosporangium fragile TaxID=46186 RepID=UPI0031F16A4B